MIALTRSHQMVLVSVLSLPMMVTIGAIGHLLSLDASRFQPLNVPTLDIDMDPLSLEQFREAQANQPIFQDPMRSISQTDRERKNVALNQVQDGDWLMKQGDFKAAKVQYQAVIDRLNNDNNSNNGNKDDLELREIATQRLDKLEKAIVAMNKKEATKRNTKKNLKVKSGAKLAIQSNPQSPQPIIGTGMTVVFSVANSDGTPPQAIRAIETHDSEASIQFQPQSRTQSRTQVKPQPSVQFVNAPINGRINKPTNDAMSGSRNELNDDRQLLQNPDVWEPETKLDLTTEPGAAGLWPEVDPVRLRLEPNSDGE